jgi:hypothetical protein
VDGVENSEGILAGSSLAGTELRAVGGGGRCCKREARNGGQIGGSKESGARHVADRQPASLNMTCSVDIRVKLAKKKKWWFILLETFAVCCSGHFCLGRRG